MSARYTTTGTEIAAVPAPAPTVQLPPMTAAELFVIRTALESASASAAEEAAAHRYVAANEDAAEVDRMLAGVAAVQADIRSREYAAQAMRLGQIQGTLPAMETMPTGWENFAR